MGAAASSHGGRLVTDSADSPHLLLPRIKARLYFGHAVNDQSMTQAAIDQLGTALDQWGGRYAGIASLRAALPLRLGAAESGSPA